MKNIPMPLSMWRCNEWSNEVKDKPKHIVLLQVSETPCDYCDSSDVKVHVYLRNNKIERGGIFCANESCGMMREQ